MVDDHSRDAGLEHVDNGKGRGIAYWIRVIIVGLVAVAAVVFIVQNQDGTQMEFFRFHIIVPLYLVIVISMALGAVIGWVLGYMRRRRRRRSDRISSENS